MQHLLAALGRFWHPVTQRLRIWHVHLTDFGVSIAQVLGKGHQVTIAGAERVLAALERF